MNGSSGWPLEGPTCKLADGLKGLQGSLVGGNNPSVHWREVPKALRHQERAIDRQWRAFCAGPRRSGSTRHASHVLELAPGATLAIRTRRAARHLSARS
jgi:hypothetical protein